MDEAYTISSRIVLGFLSFLRVESSFLYLCFQKSARYVCDSQVFVSRVLSSCLEFFIFLSISCLALYPSGYILCNRRVRNHRLEMNLVFVPSVFGTDKLFLICCTPLYSHDNTLFSLEASWRHPEQHLVLGF